MENKDAAKGKRKPFQENAKPGLEKTAGVFRKIGDVMGKIGKFIYDYRKVFMAIPVIIAAIYLAHYSAGVLPETVGLFIQSNGTYLLNISRGMAVGIPLVATGSCLVLMFCSHRALYPWLISIFTLVLPFFMMISSIFPG